MATVVEERQRKVDQIVKVMVGHRWPPLANFNPYKSPSKVNSNINSNLPSPLVDRFMKHEKPLKKIFNVTDGEVKEAVEYLSYLLERGEWNNEWWIPPSSKVHVNGTSRK